MLQVAAVGSLDVSAHFTQLVSGDPTVTPCYFFDTGDIESLTVLDGGDEVARLE